MSGDDLQLAADLIRLKGVADELLTTARGDSGGAKSISRHALVGRIDDLSSVVRERLRHNPELVDEFETVVGKDVPEEHRVWGTESTAAAIAGWLAGAIAGASLRARLEAEANAYAMERVRQERGVGFTSPPA